MSVAIFLVGDCEWWLGETAQQVADAYLAQTTLMADEAFAPDELPQMLSGAELDTHTFRDESGSVPVTRSFREQLQIEIALGGAFPRLFAVSDY